MDMWYKYRNRIRRHTHMNANILSCVQLTVKPTRSRVKYDIYTRYCIYDTYMSQRWILACIWGIYVKYEIYTRFGMYEAKFMICKKGQICKMSCIHLTRQNNERVVWHLWRSHVTHMNAAHCNALQQHTATHCNTLQHTATHCNTLQHIATLNLVYTSYTTKHQGSSEMRSAREIWVSAVCCSVLQCVAVCYCVLQGVAV